MTVVTRRYRFSASHRLHSPELSNAENSRLYGKCNNPFGHGHNYILDVSASGVVPDRTGKLFSHGKLDALVQDRILNLWHYRNLNLDIPQFTRMVPTTENVALVVSRILKRYWSAYMPLSTWLARIYIEETARNSFEVLLPKPAGLSPNASLTEADLLHV